MREQAPPEVVLDATTPIGADGTLKIVLDTALAKSLHGNSDHRYAITAEVVDQLCRTIVGSGEILVARKPFQVFAWTDHGYYQVGDAIHATFQAQTLDHKPVHGKGVATLYRVTYQAGGTPVETVAQTWDAAADEQGLASARIEGVTSRPISARVQTDRREESDDGRRPAPHGAGRRVRRSQFRFNDLELITDKCEYAPGEKVRLPVNTNRLDATVFLFVRPGSDRYGMSDVYPRPQVLRLKGKSTLVEIGVTQHDMPNFFVEALTLSNGRIFVESRELSSPRKTRAQRRRRAVGTRLQAGDEGRRQTQAHRPGRKTGRRLGRALRV